MCCFHYLLRKLKVEDTKMSHEWICINQQWKQQSIEIRKRKKKDMNNVLSAPKVKDQKGNNLRNMDKNCQFLQLKQQFMHQ